MEVHANEATAGQVGWWTRRSASLSTHKVVDSSISSCLRGLLCVLIDVDETEAQAVAVFRHVARTLRLFMLELDHAAVDLVCALKLHGQARMRTYLLGVVQALEVVVTWECAVAGRLGREVALAELLPEREAARWATLDTKSRLSRVSLPDDTYRHRSYKRQRDVRRRGRTRSLDIIT